MQKMLHRQDKSARDQTLLGSRIRISTYGPVPRCRFASPQSVPSYSRFMPTSSRTATHRDALDLISFLYFTIIGTIHRQTKLQLNNMRTR